LQIVQKPYCANEENESEDSKHQGRKWEQEEGKEIRECPERGPRRSILSTAADTELGWKRRRLREIGAECQLELILSGCNCEPAQGKHLSTRCCLALVGGRLVR